MTQQLTEAWSSRPDSLIELTTEEVFALPLEAQRDLQLQAATMRFKSLVDRLPVLKRLADEQGITTIAQLDDLAPLLIPHSAMKSYPMSVIEQSRFDRLTKWLSGFTTHDLSAVDMSDVKSIDDWVQKLDRETPVRVVHSSGTSGKLSFLPRDTDELRRMAIGWTRKYDRFHDEPMRLGAPASSVPTIFTQYRRGGMAQHRLLDALETYLYDGDADMIFAFNPGRFSADAASIGGRLRVAQSRGELGALQISPMLMERRDAFIKEQENADAYYDAFFKRCEEFRGQPIAVMGHVPMLFRVAEEGLKRGYENMFAKQSFIPAGGGTKGLTLPDHWRETVDRFFGGAKLSDGYGMTELTATQRACPNGHFHLPVWIVPFILDPNSGQPSPRVGIQTGRFGFFDLVPNSYWGGFLSGDEVTLSWGEDPCGCGRVGPYVHSGIRRYSEQEGGDDKITCAGAPEAHDRALEFMIERMG